MCPAPQRKPAPHHAAIALGSNLPSPFGDPAQTLQGAVTRIRTLGQVAAVSRFYDTAPVGYTDQPRFLNAALLLHTPLEPEALLTALLAIEREFGRDRAASAIPKGPRTLDLDLLLVDDIILHTPRLILPHPELPHRRFVLEPLAEIAPNMIHPGAGQTVAELLAACSA